MEASLFVDASVQHIHSDNAGVHGVGVLLHGSLGDRLPRMTVEGRPRNNNIIEKARKCKHWLNDDLVVNQHVFRNAQLYNFEIHVTSVLRIRSSEPLLLFFRGKCSWLLYI